MRISAAVFGLVLLPTPSVVRAQDNFDQLLRQMNKVQRELEDRIFELEIKVGDQQKTIQNLEQKGQRLESALKDSQRDFQNLQIDARILTDKTAEGQKKAAELERKLNDQAEGFHKIDLRLLTVETDVGQQKSDLKTAALRLDNLTLPPHPAGMKTPASVPKPHLTVKPTVTQTARLTHSR